MTELFANKEALLRIEPKLLKWILFIIIVFTIIIFIILTKWQTYDNYKTKGIIYCDTKCTLITSVLTDEEYKFIKINQKTFEIKILEKELKIDEEQYISYYVYTLSIDDSFKDQEIVDVNFYYNKQSILKKLVSIVVKE